MTSHERAPEQPDTPGLGDRLATPDAVGRDVVGAPRSRSALGRAGEDLAQRWLVDHGMHVVERNWRCEHGEIDIVALDGACLVICEVKARRSLAFGEPVEAVTHAKAARLRRLAAEYARTHDTGAAEVRVDVIGILFRANLTPLVRHVQGVGS